MEFALLFLALVFFVVFGVVGVVLTSVKENQRSSRDDAWTAYAARRRYAMTAEAGPGRMVRIDGTRDGATFRLEIERSDVRGEVFTRIVTPVARAGESPVVATRGRARRFAQDGPPAATGDAHFDKLFDVRGEGESAAKRVLDDEMRKALQRFPPMSFGEGLRFSADVDEIVVEWTGDALDLTRLDAAHAIAREARRAATAPPESAPAESA